MKHSLFFTAFVLTIACLFSPRLQAEHYAPTADFKADWVVVADLPEPAPANLWFTFRKSVELDFAPTKAVCRIACDSKYWLYVNGKMIVFEGQLKRGPTPNDTYFDIVDIAEHLQEGKNTIAVLMWYFGKEGFSHKNTGIPGLLFDGTISAGSKSVDVLTDTSWKGVLYSNLESAKLQFAPYEMKTDDPQPNYRLSESNIRYDARRTHPGDWTATGFDDSPWKSVKPVGKPPMAPWNQLYARLIPQWKDYGLKNYENQSEVPKVSTGEPIVCKLPYNAQVTPYLKVDAPAGVVIDMRTENYMGGSEYNVRAEYITKDGEQEYESLGWMNGHEVIYTIPAGVKIAELSYRETGFNTEFLGSFECDDPFFNKLWEKALRTLYVTMRDTYFDCPDRERAQWWGDAVNELGEAFYALDIKSSLLAKKGMYELMRWQKPDHVIFSPCPSGNDCGELPLQMLASIGAYGFGLWTNITGDTTVLEDVYPRIADYMSLWEFGDDGLILHRTGAWDWGDWGENIDLRILANAWYCMAVETQMDAASLAGMKSDDPAMVLMKKNLATIRENFDRVFWTGTEYRDPAYKGQTDDRANALAVVAGLVSEDKYAAMREVLSKQKHASPYMEKYVLEALYLMGYESDALARMKERFAKMVNHEDYSTLWEGWGIGAEGFGGGTINHAWSGGGLTLLSQYGAGVEWSKRRGEYNRFTDQLSQFKERWQNNPVVFVTPQMGTLKWIKSKNPTPEGLIEVELYNNDDAFTMELAVPQKLNADVIVVIPLRQVGEYKEGREYDDRISTSNEDAGFKFVSRVMAGEPGHPKYIKGVRNGEQFYLAAFPAGSFPNGTWKLVIKK